MPEDEARDRLPKLSEAGPAAMAASSNKHSSFDLGNQQDAEQFQEWLHGMFCYLGTRLISPFLISPTAAVVDLFQATSG